MTEVTKFEGLTLETSAFKSLCGGQFTLSTRLVKPNYEVTEATFDFHYQLERSFLFEDSQKDAQGVSQNTTSSTLRKAKSATGPMDTKRISIQQSAPEKDGRENFTSKVNAKIAKMEPTNAKTPLAPEKAPEKIQPSSNRERSTILTSGVESMDAENVASFNASRTSPLSSNGVEIHARIEEQHERKPKVRFEAEPDHIDLSETQNEKESKSSGSEVLKENLQPKVRNCGLYTRKKNKRVVQFGLKSYA